MAQSTTRKKQLPRQAASKKPAAKAKTASKQGGRPRSASNGKKPAPSKKAQASRRAAPSTHKHNQRAALVLFAVAVLLLLVALIPGTKGWLMAHHLLHGLFGIWSVLWAVLLLYVAVMSSFFFSSRFSQFLHYLRHFFRCSTVLEVGRTCFLSSQHKCIS